MINPWIYYMINDPDKIPDLNPHDDDEMRIFIAGAIAFLISSVLYALSMNLIGKNFDWRIAGWLYVPCTLVYAFLTIFLMKLSFKIADKIGKK